MLLLFPFRTTMEGFPLIKLMTPIWGTSVFFKDDPSFKRDTGGFHGQGILSSCPDSPNKLTKVCDVVNESTRQDISSMIQHVGLFPRPPKGFGREDLSSRKGPFLPTKLYFVHPRTPPKKHFKQFGYVSFV